MNLPLLEQLLKDRNFPLSHEVFLKFEKYRELLIEENQKINLTAITEPQAVEIKHFIDSIWFPFPQLRPLSMLDVGSGAGFPGIPLHLMHEGLETTLLEPIQKKATFLNLVIRTLKLNHIHVVCDRAETWIQQHREQFDVVVARAVAPLNILLELTAPFVKLHGHLLLLKGPSGDEEWSQADQASQALGLMKKKVYRYALPVVGDTRVVLEWEKIKPTSPTFPRSYALIKSKPL